VNSLKSVPKYWITIVLAISIFLICELALQLRSHLRYGTSVFNVFGSENNSTYIVDDKTGLKLLQKNAVIEGSQARIETNSLGLRSPEISIEKPEGVIRIAVVGASSVMGTYTRDNNDVLAYQLQDKLSSHYGSGLIEVINAGIAGYSLADQQKMVKNVLFPLALDGVIIYSGFNDLSSYCGTSSEVAGEDYGLHSVDAPSWLLTVELITKNTIWLRTLDSGSDKLTAPSTLDTGQFVADLNRLFSLIESSGLAGLVLTNPRSYSREMPEAEQRALSETARYYSPCFDTAGLHNLYDKHNDLIEQVALQHQLSVFRLDQKMPHGKKYFGDATHFTVFGTDYAVDLITKDVINLVDKISQKGSQLPEMTE
jgi:hypothetical protein